MASHSDSFSCDVLEFRAALELLRAYLSGPLAEPRLETIRPGTRLENIKRDLNRAAEALEAQGGDGRPVLNSLKDPRPILERLGVEALTLTAQEILALLDMAESARGLRRRFDRTPFLHLRELLSGLADFRSLVEEIRGKVLPDGSIDSSASPALARLRKEIARLRLELRAKLEKLVDRLGRGGALQEEWVTLRNGRFVLPVRVEEKRRVSGVVHGASSSGATVYVEPLETVPLNNELVELQDRESAEIERILGEFTSRFRAQREELQAAAEILSELDLAFAKAEFAREYEGCIPEFEEKGGSAGILELKDVRHPVLEKALRGQGRRSVPVTVELGEPKRMVIISGPNAGGKTVALKTIGMAVLMAQAGIPVLASRARLTLFGRLLADIGDQQSIQANLSTFSAHISNIQSMLAVAGPGDLVLLDELGASTEPHEGAALGIAILEGFRERGAMTFATTHYSRLKAYAAETPEAVNASMEFDEATLQPTYRLLLGLPGKSSAMEIAARLGLDPAVVAGARALLSPADAEVETLLAKLHEQRVSLEEERARLAEHERDLEARQEALTREFEQQRRARLAELDALLDETLRESRKKVEAVLRDLNAGGRLVKKAARSVAAVERETKEAWDAQVVETLGAPPKVEEALAEVALAVGGRVRVAKITTPGTVVALHGEEVEVEVGRMRLRVRREEVRPVAEGKTAFAEPRVVIARSAEAPASAAGEINVIGDTAEQARERVDQFLDQAYMSGNLRLRIVHGHGKGILKRALHEMLASHPHVEKFYPAPQRKGGAGATVVELKA